MVKGQFFILTQAVFFNDPYCSFLLDNYYCSIGPILASFSLNSKNDYKKTKGKKRSVGIHFGTSGLDFFLSMIWKIFCQHFTPIFL